MLKKTYILLICVLLINTTNAQQILMGSFNSGISNSGTSKVKMNVVIGYSQTCNAFASRTSKALTQNDNEIQTQNETDILESVLYPNPAKDFVYIKLSKNISKLAHTIDVYDIMGVKQISGDSNLLFDNQIGINLQQLKQGRYIIKISFTENIIPTQIFKLIKL